MRRDQVLKKAGITAAIKPSPETERSRRAQERVLEKLGEKPRHATALTVLERTELRKMETAGLIGYHPGKSMWMLRAQLERELAEGAVDATTKADAAAAAVAPPLPTGAVFGRSFYPGTLCEWDEAKRPELICRHCGGRHNDHGGPDEVAAHFGISVGERNKLCRQYPATLPEQPPRFDHVRAVAKVELVLHMRDGQTHRMTVTDPERLELNAQRELKDVTTSSDTARRYEYSGVGSFDMSTSGTWGGS